MIQSLFKGYFSYNFFFINMGDNCIRLGRIINVGIGV